MPPTVERIDGPNSARKSAQRLRFGLLGALSVSEGSTALRSPPRRLHGLLALLLLDPGPHPRDRLAELTRPDLPLSIARRRLNHLLWVLRTAIPTLHLTCDQESVAIHRRGRITDVEEFRHAARGSTPAAWRAAARLYKGDLLPGCDHPWVQAHRKDIRDEFVALAHRACPSLIALGAPAEAQEMAARALRSAPLDETVARDLMRAHLAQGQGDEAVTLFQSLTATFRGKGIALEPETVALAAELSVPVRPLVDTRTVPSPPITTPAIGQAAVYRGDFLEAGRIADQLRGGDAASITSAQLLEADLASEAGELAFASQLLARCEGLGARTREAAIARRQGNPQAALGIAMSAALQAADAGDEGMRGNALVEVAWSASALGESHHALSSADTAVHLARTNSSPRLECRALLALGAEKLRQGRIHAALRALQESAETASRQQLTAERAEALHHIAQIHRRHARLSQALNTHAASLELWQQLGNPRGIAESLLGEAATLTRAGHHARAVAAVKKAVATLGTRDPEEPLLADCQLTLGSIALARCGDESELVLQLSQHSLLTGSSRRHVGQGARLAVLRGTALHLAGHHGQAIGELARARSLHERREERLEVPAILALQCLVLLALGSFAEAEARAGEAMLLAAAGNDDADMAPLLLYANGMALQAQGQQREGAAMFQRGFAALEAISATVRRPPAVLHRDHFCRALVHAARGQVTRCGG